MADGYAVRDVRTMDERKADLHDGLGKLQSIRDDIDRLIKGLEDLKKNPEINSRPLSIGITELETGQMWLGRAMHDAVENSPDVFWVDPVSPDEEPK